DHAAGRWRADCRAYTPLGIDGRLSDVQSEFVSIHSHGVVEIMNRNDHPRDTRETGRIRILSMSRGVSPKRIHRIDPDQDTVGGVRMHVAPSCTGHQREDVESATRKGVSFGMRVWGLQHKGEQPLPAPREKFLETVAERSVWVGG